MLHRAGAEKQQTFEDAVIEDVQQAGGKADDGERRGAGRQSEHAKTDAEQNDPDVLDAGIGEQPLQIMLRQGKQHAENTARRADGDEGPAPPWLRCPEQCQDAYQTVNADLDHRPRHQCRGMAGGDRMRFRQPDMRRDDAGLRAKADQRQNEGHRTQRRGGLQDAAVSVEIGAARQPAEQHEEHEKKRRSDMGRRQIRPRGMPHALLPVIENDQEERRQCHDLPGQQEQQSVMRGNDQGHCRGQQVQVKPACRDAGPLAAAAHVAAAIDRG